MFGYIPHPANQKNISFNNNTLLNLTLYPHFVFLFTLKIHFASGQDFPFLKVLKIYKDDIDI